MEKESQALTVVAPAAMEYLMPVMTLTTARQRLAEFQEFVKSYLVDGEDFGIIPGTQKPTLWKPGADKLCELYGLADTYPASRIQRNEDWDRNLIDFEIVCVLVRKCDGMIVGEGIGCCNSLESKYVKSKKSCADLKNTILKMAKKRAKIDAVIAATRSSGIFSQEIEQAEKETESGPNVGGVGRAFRGQLDKIQELNNGGAWGLRLAGVKPLLWIHNASIGHALMQMNAGQLVVVEAFETQGTAEKYWLVTEIISPEQPAPKENIDAEADIPF